MNKKLTVILGALFLIVFSAILVSALDSDVTCAIDTYTVRADGDQLNFTATYTDADNAENITTSNYTITTLDGNVVAYGGPFNTSDGGGIDNETINISHFPAGFEDQDVTLTIYGYNITGTLGLAWDVICTDTESFAVNNSVISGLTTGRTAKVTKENDLKQTFAFYNTTAAVGTGEQIDSAVFVLKNSGTGSTNKYSASVSGTNSTNATYEFSRLPNGIWKWYFEVQDTDGSSSYTTSESSLTVDVQQGSVTGDVLEGALKKEGKLPKKDNTTIIIIGIVLFVAVAYWFTQQGS